ncbi:MAG TPA: EAL domain-containing protein, partial [Thermoanaerobaculia bacterium]|nr:EAL domain-containing protein [Thermoanaerobaculia bacterium]
MVDSLSKATVEQVARVAGLRDFRTPTLEAVEQRRLQLWMVTMLLLVAVAGTFVLFSLVPQLTAPEWVQQMPARLGFLVLVGLFCAYAIEKELQLRRLTNLLVEERVVTAALTGRVRELTALLEAGRALNLDLDLAEVLERMLRCAKDLLDGGDASIMLVQAEDELTTVFTVGRSFADGARVRMGEGIAGRVAESREPLLIQGRLDHGHYLAVAEDQRPVSAMSAPLVHRGNLLGVLNLNARPDKRYTEHDLRALSLFAEQAAVAVANAQLFEAQRLIARQTSYQALHDPLTHLPNRSRFHARLRHALGHTKAGRMVGLLLVDLDDFKRINDSLGHLAGDEVLIGFAERLKAAVRANDTVARFGGDELVVMVEGLRSADEAAMRAEALLTILEEPFSLAGREVRLTASIGISLEGSGGSTAEELMRSAGTALHAAKQRGAGSLAVFVETMHADVLRRLDLEGELRQAVAKGEIEVHYQPIFRLTDRRVVALEALLRWHHPRRGLIPAASFVGFAEQAGVLRELDLLVLSEACRFAHGLDCGAPVAVHVNLLPTRLHEPQVVERVSRVLAETGLSPQRLVLEITESAVVGDAEGVVERLTALRDLGVRIALDDFGTGYSSLAYLRHFPVHTIKIDRAFTEDLDEDP